MIEKFYKFKQLMIIGIDFSLIFISYNFTLYLTSENLLFNSQDWLVYVSSVIIYSIYFYLFKLSRDSLSYYGIKLLTNLFKAIIFFSFSFIIFYKTLRSLSYIEVINKFWIIYIIFIFIFIFSSRFIIFFFINLYKSPLPKKRLLIFFDDKFQFEDVIRLKDYISDFYISHIISLSQNDINKKIENVNYFDLDKLNSVSFDQSDTFLVLSHSKDISIYLDKIISKTKCKANQIKLLNNIDFKLSTLLKNNQNLLNDINLEDLMQREKIKPIDEIYQDFINNKVVLIIGAGGSIGKVIFQKIKALNAKKIILLDKNEEGIFNIQNLDEYDPNIVKDFLIDASFNNLNLKYIFEYHKPDIVFNAAANKHVKIFTENLNESTRNTLNICINTIDLSKKYKVKNYILISSDKAINPTSHMGKIKNICEKYSISNNINETKISCVRFGNVLGSSGSVVPLFQDLISKRKDIYIRHRDLTRYFMLIDEAAELVIQSCAISQGGEIFTLDMGKPVKIIDLAKKIISLNGLSIKNDKNPNGDIEIKISKLLKGEKIEEEIFTEGKEKTIHPKIFKDQIIFDKNNFSKCLEKLISNVEYIKNIDNSKLIDEILNN